MTSRSILLVDDDASLREVTRLILERDNYDVLEAPNYAKAVEQGAKNVDLALVDYVLPDRDGLEVAEALRKTKPGLPVILMTAYGSEDVAVRALRAGVTDYIGKPFSARHLRERVATILKGEDERKNEDIKNPGEVLDNISDYLRAHYDEDISLPSLATMAGMSRFRFCRLFKERFGQSFVSYVNRIRIRIALELLGKPQLTISEIAYFVGFKTVGHFERVFKDIQGLCPREYRKRLQSPGTPDSQQ